MGLAFSTLIPRVKLSLCRCAVMASSKQTRSVTLVRVTTQHAVIHRLANSELEPCATRVVRLAAQETAGLPRERKNAGDPGMIGAMHQSFVPATRQRARRISPHQTVRTSRRSSRADTLSYFFKVKAVGLEGWRAPMVFARHWTVGFPHAADIRFGGTLTLFQCNASRRALRSG